MTPVVGRVAAGVAGVVVAGVVVLGTSDAVAPETVSPERSVASPSGTTERHARRSPLMLAWSPTGSGGLAPSVGRDLRRSGRVRALTWVYSSLDWLAPDRDSAMEIPIEVAAVDPRTYANFVAPAEAPAVLALGPHEALLAEDEAKLRGDADTLHLRGGDYRIVGTISDVGTGGYEALVAAPAPDTWTIVDRALLIELAHRSDRRRVSASIRSQLAPGQMLRLRAKGETPYLRYGDAVLPQLIVKKNFGEFGAVPHPDGTISIERRWIARNIVDAHVPLLGRVTCHRAVIPQLRMAMRELKTSGVGYLVHRSEFGGCFGARFINGRAGTRLSHHAWGIAVDLNVAENPFGARPTQEERVVRVMEDHGFTWGGRWIVPDGMHFEWVRFP
ncbi:MAG TPA: M15 family metallopeptidase [Actinomycetota bacterium]|nr:M15 family metallopeptidase [Actinomycetota bacterium]